MAHPLDTIIADTTVDIFETAGGFDFTDEIALALNAKWRQRSDGPVLVSALDLAWLLDGYARARLASISSDDD